MYITIIALFVAYWYTVIALYFYGLINPSTGMVRLRNESLSVLLSSPTHPCHGHITK